jgi:hypothetical protein
MWELLSPRLWNCPLAEAADDVRLLPPPSRLRSPRRRPEPRGRRPPEVPSRELLTRCLSPDGTDHEAWSAFVGRHGAEVRRLLVAQLSRFAFNVCAAEIDDWEQEVYWRLLRYRRPCAFHTERMMWRFLMQTVARVVVDGWRQRHRLKRRPLRPHELPLLGCRKRRVRNARGPTREPAGKRDPVRKSR